MSSILGPIIGGALGLLGGSKGSTTTQTNEPASFLQPYAPEFAAQGYDLSQQPYNPYPNFTVAPFSQDQLSGMDMARQNAGYTSPLFGQGQAELGKTIGGDYLSPDSNPFLKSMYDSAAGRMADAYRTGTSAQTNAAAGFNRAFGGSAHQQVMQNNNRAFGDSLGNLANQMYGGNYQAERGRQLQAAQYAPQFAGAQQQYGMNNVNSMLNIGGMQQNLGQQYLSADRAQFDEAQQHPYKQFDVFRSLFNSNLGNTATANQPGVGALQGGLGGLLGGYALSRMF